MVSDIVLLIIASTSKSYPKKELLERVNTAKLSSCLVLQELQ